MEIRSIEELQALLTAQEGITLEVNGEDVTLTVDVRCDESYFLEGNTNSLLDIGFYNPNNTADDFVLDSFKDFDKVEKAEEIYLVLLENYFDNSMEDMKAESSDYYSNRDY